MCALCLFVHKLNHVVVSLDRFGSFEIFKPTDPVSRRHGPSEGRRDILVQLLDYTIQTCYPQVKGQKVRVYVQVQQLLPIF